MQTTLPKRAVNHQRWHRLYELWKQGGKSQQLFCENQHIGLASFRRWHRSFESETGGALEKESINFVSVTIRGIPVQALTIQVNNGLRIKVPTEFDPKALKHVIQILQAIGSLSVSIPRSILLLV